jgi:hypothetical protein
MLRYDRIFTPNAPWCRCILFRYTMKAKFSNLQIFKVITNIISLRAWPLFRRYPCISETLIYWLGFQWVQLRVGRGKGGLVYNFVLNHIYFRYLAHQQKVARGGGDGTLWPTNINQKSSSYCFNIIWSFYSVFLILCWNCVSDWPNSEIEKGRMAWFVKWKEYDSSFCYVSAPRMKGSFEWFVLSYINNEFGQDTVSVTAVGFLAVRSLYKRIWT